MSVASSMGIQLERKVLWAGRSISVVHANLHMLTPCNTLLPGSMSTWFAPVRIKVVWGAYGNCVQALGSHLRTTGALTVRMAADSICFAVGSWV